MKKLLLIAVTAFVFVSSSLAQQRNAIGLRLGYGAEISYQRYVADNGRIEADLGLNGFGSNFNASALYQWVWDIPSAGGLGWYVGLGASIGSYEKHFSTGILGQIGLEYKFNAPITLSLDWRPELRFVPETGFGYRGLMLGIKFRF